MPTDHDNLTRDAQMVADAMFDVPADARTVNAAIERLGLTGPILNYAALCAVHDAAKLNEKCP